MGVSDLLNSRIPVVVVVMVHMFCGLIVYMLLRFAKALDCVNYWKLFNKLLADNINISVANILAY